jgi:pimeloyl-ACP methyl ester carboxylesterase
MLIGKRGLREHTMIEIQGETFEGTFPFAPHYLRVNGFDMHFVDEGQGEPIVLLHGDPTWGYLWRSFISPLSRNCRCVVPDHMGMGKSGVPQEPNPYRLRHHAANLEFLLLHLNLHDLTLALHNWGGPVGLDFAVRHREKIKRLVLLNTWAFAPWPGGPLPRLLEIIRSPRGEKFVLGKNGYLEQALVGTTLHPENLTPTVLAAYRAPFPTPESRLAMLCWSRDIPMEERDPSYTDMKRIEQALPVLANIPTLLVWGMRDPVLPASVLRMWQQRLPNAVTLEINDASHFLQEDAPERIVIAMREFIAAHP